MVQTERADWLGREQTHKSKVAGERKPHSPVPVSSAEAPSASPSKASRATRSRSAPCSAGLTTRWRTSIGSWKREGGSGVGREAKKANSATAPGPRCDSSPMTMDELRAHVSKISTEMAKQESPVMSHHAEQAIYLHAEVTGREALPDLLPCLTQTQSSSGCPSVASKQSTSPLAFSSKPSLSFMWDAPPTEVAAQQLQAIHIAKEQALRKARKDCDRAFPSGSRSDPVGSGSMHARDQRLAETSILIDVPLPQKENTHAPLHTRSHGTEPAGQVQCPPGQAVQGHNVSINLTKSALHASQQPSGRSSVGQPTVINLGFAKKHMPQQSVRQVPLQVLSQQHPSRHLVQPLQHQQLAQQQQHHHHQQQPTITNVLATYTQVHFDAQRGVTPDGYAIAQPSAVAYNTACSAQGNCGMSTGGSIMHRGPRLLPKEEMETRRRRRAQDHTQADFNKENLNVQRCN
jgi:hypothetical protein